MNQVTFSPSLDSPNPSLSDEGQGVGTVCLEQSFQTEVDFQIMWLFYTNPAQPPILLILGLVSDVMN